MAHNKYIAVSYKLNTVDGNEKEFIEEATAERPFQFISGFGVTLEAFEREIIDIEKGGTFCFQLNKDEAYGDHERVSSTLKGRCFASTDILTMKTSLWMP